MWSHDDAWTLLVKHYRYYRHLLVPHTEEPPVGQIPLPSTVERSYNEVMEVNFESIF